MSGTKHGDCDRTTGNSGGGNRYMEFHSNDKKRKCYFSARVVVSRMIAVLRKCKGRKNKSVGQGEMSLANHGSDGGVSGLPVQEIAVNMAAGLGLLSLIAASQAELEKTVELRKQMEAFLTSAKQEHSQTAFGDAVSTPIDGPSTLSPYSRDEHTIHSEPRVDGINQLEEELAAELDRLQFDLDTDGGLETGLEISENQDETSKFGVPPLELERRLHELLEARQEERIKELEAELECMKIKLQEKEEEVIWWKDVAKTIDSRVSESSKAKV